MRKSVVLFLALVGVLGFSSCHHDFAEKNPLGFVPIIIFFIIICIMTAYALRLTFRKKK